MNIDKICDAAVMKSTTISEKPLVYFNKSALGGMFIIIGALTASFSGGLFFGTNPALASFLLSAAFPIALLFILYFGGELFTSNVFVMTVGCLNKKTSPKMLLKVWGASYFGNLVSIIFIVSLFCLSRSYSPSFAAFVQQNVANKLDFYRYFDTSTSAFVTSTGIGIFQLIMRSVFCNFLVCLAYYAFVKVSSEVCKFLLIFLCVFAFMIAGFEHSIANMAFFTLGYYLVPDFSLWAAVSHMFFCTIGNIIGGALFLAVPVFIIERK